MEAVRIIRKEIYFTHLKKQFRSCNKAGFINWHHYNTLFIKELSACELVQESYRFQWREMKILSIIGVIIVVGNTDIRL